MALTRSPTLPCFSFVLIPIMSKAMSGLEPCTAQLSWPIICLDSVCSLSFNGSLFSETLLGSIVTFFILSIYSEWSRIILLGSCCIPNPMYLNVFSSTLLAENLTRNLFINLSKNWSPAWRKSSTWQHITPLSFLFSWIQNTAGSSLHWVKPSFSSSSFTLSLDCRAPSFRPYKPFLSFHIICCGALLSVGGFIYMSLPSSFPCRKAEYVCGFYSPFFKCCNWEE